MDYIAIADKVMEEFNPIFYGGKFWYYHEGCYREAEMEMRNFLQTEMKHDFTSNRVKQVFFTLESRVFREKIEVNSTLINLKNGTYNWIEDNFVPHNESGNHEFMNQIPINFNPHGECPKIKQFLSEVMVSDDEKVLLQFLGYCLIPSARFEKAIMFNGDGANGKSTLLKLIIALIGEENISSLSLFDLKHTFRLAEIVGKLINVYPDLPNNKLMDSSIFKALVSGDPIMGERKYARPFTFRSFAKLIFSTNKLPETDDISPAFLRRWLIIDFPHTFNGKKRDTSLINKLTTQEELEGLLQLAIQGLHKLNQEQEFHRSDKMDSLLSDYERMNNSVKAFISEKCLIRPDAEIKKTALCDAYNLFTFEEKLKTLGRNEFAKELRRQEPSIKEIHATAKLWRGIKLLE